MATHAGGTTITEQGSPEYEGEARGLALDWAYPEPSAPHVNLLWEHQPELVIGRDEDCAVRLSGKEVSRRHAVLRHEGGAVVLADLDSRNGTRVNGQPVSSSPLSVDDVVRIGNWVGVVTRLPGPFGEIAPGLLGGPVLRAALDPLQKAAKSDLPVVLEGETGTGKEVAARSLHLWSERAGSFVAVNCAALPEGLAEAELFGYRRGAFTGADRASPGLFRDAHKGTLLLDEVSDLPLGVQAKLLRVLEQREVQPLGETQPVPVDVRVVVAGQESLSDSVAKGRFRGDLLARLEGVTVRLPPLRQRRGDVPPLFLHLLEQLSSGPVPEVRIDLIERLATHDWPFNVRELVLAVRRILVFHEKEPVIHAGHLAERFTRAGASASSPSGSRDPQDVALPELVMALRAAGGNVTRAAATLGITRQRAYRLMDAGDVDLESLRQPDGSKR